ncbi:kinase-like domain-containing protein [Suillus subalutaceus]|uniref:kinase-like domain-containing protein n=1 Tax=Suillus subalutaceus TaxID=48586 RepID=UPI001B873D07|nr:kinase-like domain-containing protein [Suillus subalutaceus]KAG1837934.1 kinase-like domain-containing protein [Suillus subalutaceus]
MRGFALEDDIVGDLTPLITKLGSPITCSPFSQVYRSTIEASRGTTEVAVKVIIIDHKRTMAKIEKAMRRELRVWFRLRHSTIVPLLGIAYLESPLPAFISQWMPFGTLNIYLEKQATALTASMKVALAKGIADGLNYLHSENVVHGDLQPVCTVVSSPILHSFVLVLQQS